jgi:hypothetical protein
MQNLASSSHLIGRWIRYQLETILVICFLLSTPFLVIETLHVQHSCHPMIHWSGNLPAECQPSPPPPPTPWYKVFIDMGNTVISTVEEHLPF